MTKLIQLFIIAVVGTFQVNAHDDACSHDRNPLPNLQSENSPSNFWNWVTRGNVDDLADDQIESPFLTFAGLVTSVSIIAWYVLTPVAKGVRK